MTRRASIPFLQHGDQTAVVTARLLEAQLFGVHAADVVLLLPLVTAILLLVGIAASLPAARRAANADPLIAIRAE
jgi:hypothetical protein